MPKNQEMAWIESARQCLLDPSVDENGLYNRWFHRLDEKPQVWPDTAAYWSAMLDPQHLESGWVTVGGSDVLPGAVMAKRGGLDRLVVPPEMVPERSTDLLPGRGSRLKVHPLTSAVTGGFWHLWSAGWQRQAPERLQRYYLNVAPAHALTLARLVAMLAPPRAIWALKVLSGAHDSGRRDRAVLYLPKPGSAPTPWLSALLHHLAPLCEPDLPPFVAQLVPGIGRSEDPGAGLSYGQALCRAVMTAAPQKDDAQAFFRAARLAVLALNAQAAPYEPPVMDVPVSPAIPPVAAVVQSAIKIDWRAKAMEIAQALSTEAVWSGPLCTFVGAVAPDAPGQPVAFSSLGGDLYEGTAGVARFLGLCARLSGDERLRRTALGAVAHALERSDGVSLFSGRMGAGLVAMELGLWLHQPDLVAQGASCVEACSDQALRKPEMYDFLVGTAGVLAGLLWAYEQAGTVQWLARARQLGEILLDRAVEDGVADTDGTPLSWPLSISDQQRLCGLAHGASGCALAFDALAKADPSDRRWAAVARRARRHERAHLSPQHGSWADLRTLNTTGVSPHGSYPHMWCHGSVGIGAERLHLLDSDLLARGDALTALSGAKRYAEMLLAGPCGAGAGDAVNASVCHGLSGMVDLFVDAWQSTQDARWLSLASRLGEFMCNDARRQRGWRSGIPGGFNTPGLMLGRSGAGWALLRLAEPEQVPSAWRLLQKSFGPQASDHDEQQQTDLRERIRAT